MRRKRQFTLMFTPGFIEWLKKSKFAIPKPGGGVNLSVTIENTLRMFCGIDTAEIERLKAELEIARAAQETKRVKIIKKT